MNNQSNNLKPRQKPIPITSQERAILDNEKRRYEQSTGDKGDWGKFLRTVTLLGLAAAGVYGLVRASRRSAQSVDVICTNCSDRFVMALPTPVDSAIFTCCPNCGQELVVHIEQR
jgi:hypothetical protein